MPDARDKPVTSQTLDRGLRALAAVAASRVPLSTNEVAAQLSLHRSIVYRLLCTLEGHALVARESDGRFRAGSGLLQLARGVQPDLVAAVSPELRRLADEFGVTAVLTAAEGDEAVCLAAVEPQHTAVHVAYRAGLRHSLQLGASGLAVLASRPPAPGEPSSVSTAREIGWVRTEGELQRGAVGVAAPLPGRDASLGAVFFAGHEDEAAITTAVATAARTLAASGR